MKIALATLNKHKIAEIREILGCCGIELLSLYDCGLQPNIIEDGASFKENAYIKAAEVAKLTGEIALADDSGLLVDALDGSPGIYSARYAGDKATDEENNRYLLKRMQDVPKKRRTARFCCVIAIVTPDNKAYYAEGFCEGLIAREPAGNTGFGYDPLFIIPKYNKSLAQLGADIKNSISHRYHALMEAKKIISSLLD